MSERPRELHPDQPEPFDPNDPLPVTLASLPADPPPDLWLGLLEPGGANLLYGRGGVGKGLTVAWIISQLQQQMDDFVPLIFDAEGHANEWINRISGLGGDPQRVRYLQPRALPLQWRSKPLYEALPYIGWQAERVKARLLIVDSLLAGINARNADALKSDAELPYLYTAALDECGLTSLSIGHPPRTSSQSQTDPYGSVAWVNAMRMCWLVLLGENSQPDQHEVRLEQRKSNQRGPLGGVLIDFAFGADSMLTGATRRDDAAVTRLWMLTAYVDGPATINQLTERYMDEHGLDPQERSRVWARLRARNNALLREGVVLKDGKVGKQDKYRRTSIP